MVVDYPNYDEEFLAMLANRVPLLISLDDQGSHAIPKRSGDQPIARPDPRRLPALTPAANWFRTALHHDSLRVSPGPQHASNRAGGPPNVLIALGGGDVLRIHSSVPRRS